MHLLMFFKIEWILDPPPREGLQGRIFTRTKCGRPESDVDKLAVSFPLDHSYAGRLLT